MGWLVDNCTIAELTKETIQESEDFTCDNPDLDEFFLKDAPLYRLQLLGKTYCFRLDSNPEVIVCAFTLANDSIRVSMLPNSRAKKVERSIPHSKSLRRYPGLLIGRLGVNRNFQGKGIGSELLSFICSWFLDDSNKTGCRFLIVDAYNNPRTLRFYEQNGFVFLFSSEGQEAVSSGLDRDTKLKTRLMFYDLLDSIESTDAETEAGQRTF